MFEARKTLGALVAAGLVFSSFGSFAGVAAAGEHVNGLAPADFADAVPSKDARYGADWVMGSADNQHLPFAVVDKKGAKIFVFDGRGKIIGSSTILLGLAPGDNGVAGIAKRSVASLLPSERTTPAGRFASEPGHNNKGEPIVWIDYDAGIAIHRLRPAPAQDRRPQRMASTSPDDKRISFGCVVVPVAFYESVIGPVLGKSRGVVYVLPETRPVEAMFGAMQLGMNTSR